MGVFKKILPPREMALQDFIEQKFEAFKEQAPNLRKDPFTFAIYSYYNGLKYKDIKRPGILTIIDYELVSTRPRMFILDLENEKVLYSGYVAHGEKSGGNKFVYWSNKDGSNATPIGFFITGEDYEKGKRMKLDGLEEGVNDLSRDPRGIIVHGAWYVSDEFIKEYGRLGRSDGCPAVKEEDAKFVINTIKDGTAFFIYYPDSDYLSTSRYTKRKTAEEKFTEIQKKGRDIITDTKLSQSY